jgi:hypothetical protein
MQKPVHERLVALMRSSPIEARRAAMRTLTVHALVLGQVSPKVKECLGELLVDASPQVREAAQGMVQKLGLKM